MVRGDDPSGDTLRVAMWMRRGAIMLGDKGRGPLICAATPCVTRFALQDAGTASWSEAKLAALGVVLPGGAIAASADAAAPRLVLAAGCFAAINSVKRSFGVSLHGVGRNDQLTLTEHFAYADGAHETKTWRFRKLGPDVYACIRDDMAEETLIRVSGARTQFSYAINLGIPGADNWVRFHDTMTLGWDGRLLNTAWVTKYGLPVARVRVEVARHRVERIDDCAFW